MWASSRKPNEILRATISMILFLVMICVPIVFEIIMPLTSWGLSFLTNLKIENYSLFFALHKFGTAGIFSHVLCIILLTSKLIIALFKRICHFISTHKLNSKGGKHLLVVNTK